MEHARKKRDKAERDLAEAKVSLHSRSVVFSCNLIHFKFEVIL